MVEGIIPNGDAENPGVEISRADVEMFRAGCGGHTAYGETVDDGGHRINAGGSRRNPANGGGSLREDVVIRGLHVAGDQASAASDQVESPPSVKR